MRFKAGEGIRLEPREVFYFLLFAEKFWVKASVSGKLCFTKK